MTATEILRLLARQAELSVQFVVALESGERLAPDVLDLERELEAIGARLGDVPAERLRELADQLEREVALYAALSGLMAAVMPILQRTYPKSAWANAWEIAEAARDGREPRGLISPAG